MLRVCYTEKAPNAWHHQGTQKTGDTYKRPSLGTTPRPSTRHHRKTSPRAKPHNTNQHSSRARLQHSNLPPSLQTPGRGRVSARSSQPTLANAKHRRAKLHYNTVTTRTSGDTRRPPSVRAGVRCCNRGVARREQQRPGTTRNDRNNGTNKTTNKPTMLLPNSQQTTLNPSLMNSITEDTGGTSLFWFLGVAGLILPPPGRTSVTSAYSACNYTGLPGPGGGVYVLQRG